MRSYVLFGGLLTLAGAASAYGCSSSTPSHPAVLDGTSGSGSGSRSGSGSGGTGSSGSSSGGSSGSGSSSGVGSDAGSGSSSGSGSDAGNGSCVGAHAGCNSLQVCGPQVNLVSSPDPFPTAAGGTIAPGTYVLTGLVYYGSGLTTWERETLQFTSMPNDAGDQTFQYADLLETEATAGAPVSYEGVLTATGTGYSMVYSCPMGQMNFAGYTATPTTLTVMSQPLVSTYTKQ